MTSGVAWGVVQPSSEDDSQKGRRALRCSDADVNEACVGSAGNNELIGEWGPKTVLDAEAKRRRKEQQQYGAKLFTGFCFTYLVLMLAAFLQLLPVMSWERMKFDIAEKYSVFLRDHMWVPFLLSLLYVIVVFGGQYLLKDRKGFGLKYPLVFWNMGLALFSLAGSLRTVPVLLDLLYNKGTYHLVCGDTRQDWVIDNPAGVWTMLFIFSKVPELIDTLFIVLRKRQLIVLHWYHHITVMCFCWHSWATFCLNGLVYSSMNLTVHAFMYTFYGLTALGYRPTKYAMYITVIQILQMVVGTAVTVYVNWHIRFVVYQPLVWHLKNNWNPLDPERNTDPTCKVHTLNALAGLLMYGSYLWLFCVFFYKSYLRPKSEKAKSS